MKIEASLHISIQRFEVAAVIGIIETGSLFGAAGSLQIEPILVVAFFVPGLGIRDDDPAFRGRS